MFASVWVCGLGAVDVEDAVGVVGGSYRSRSSRCSRSGIGVRAVGLIVVGLYVQLE